MKIGLIRPYEIEYNNQDLVDLNRSIKRLGHEARDIYVDKLGVSIKKNRIDLSQISSMNESEDIKVDGAFLRHLGTIKDYEQFSGRLWSVRAMEQTGVFVMNEIVSWLLASDKLASLSILAKSNLPIPETFLSEDMYFAYRKSKEMGETVIKPLRGAMGFGVFRISDSDFAMHVFSYLTNLSKPIYMQKYLDKKGGGDYRVIVVGGQVVGAEFRKGVGWKSNVAQGAKVTKAKVNSQMAELALRATEVLGLEYAGIDIAETRDGYFILETNPTMSWQGFKKATKIDVAGVLIKHLISRIKD